MNFKSMVAQLANRINQPHVIETYMRKVFASGVEWQKKQSPWIRVEERLPDEEQRVLVGFLYYYKYDDREAESRKHIDVFTYENGIWTTDSDISYLGKSVEKDDIKVICWMPILSFDEILEANRDVLERIKEKGGLIMLTILRETYPAAKKEHICEFCACKIQPGQKYVRQTNVYDGVVYDFITHQECKEVAHELRMYDDCYDSGLNGESFREELDSYIYANHYDEHTDDVYTSWQVNYYEMAKKVLKELRKEHHGYNGKR